MSSPSDQHEAMTQRWKRWRRMTAIWTALMLVIAICAGYSFDLRERLSSSMARAEQLQSAAKETVVLLGMIADLQAGQRGYLLSGDDRLLEQYQTASLHLPQQFAKLRTLLTGYPEYLATLVQIEDETEAKQKDLDSLVKVFQAQGRAAAGADMRADVSRQMMDGIRSALIELQFKLLESTSGQRRSLDRVLRERTATIYAAFSVAMLIGIAGVILLRRHLATLRQEDELREQIAQSQRESREKSTFLANMSHEIRTPMNAIFGFSRLLQARSQDPIDRRYIEAIATSGRSLLELIDDILDLSRIEAGRLEIRKAPTSLRELAQSITTVFSRLAADKGLALRSVVHHAVPEAVLLDATRVRQVLFNLVGNAVKYTDRGSVELRIAAMPEKDGRVMCTFAVEDTGMGIAPHHLKSIFDPFVQAGGGVLRARSGAGLGLSISRQLVQLMDGTITAESRFGQGSIFRVALPRVERATAAAPEPGPHYTLDSLPPCSILAADDVELNCELLEAMFSDTHHHLLVARSGTEAVELATAHRPDVILMDIRMPDMDGMEVLRRLRADKNNRQTPVIAVTASSLAGDRERLRAMFDGYVAKPFTAETLSAEMRRVLPGSGAPILSAEAPALMPTDFETADFPDEARAELQRIARDAWPALRDTPAMREVRDFAEILAALAARVPRSALKSYASQLSIAAATFDAARVDALMAQFPQLVQELLGGAESVTRNAA